MISIDKDIPMPARAHDGRTKYPFHTMEVGDSFAVALSGDDTIDTLAKRVRTAMGAAGRRLGRKFILGAEAAGVRIWRTA